MSRIPSKHLQARDKSRWPSVDLDLEVWSRQTKVQTPEGSAQPAERRKLGEEEWAPEWSQLTTRGKVPQRNSHLVHNLPSGKHQDNTVPLSWTGPVLPGILLQGATANPLTACLTGGNHEQREPAPEGRATQNWTGPSSHLANLVNPTDPGTEDCISVMHVPTRTTRLLLEIPLGILLARPSAKGQRPNQHSSHSTGQNKAKAASHFVRAKPVRSSLITCPALDLKHLPKAHELKSRSQSSKVQSGTQD